MKLLAIACLLAPQEPTSGLDALLLEAAEASPAAVLRLADDYGPRLTDEDLLSLAERCGSAEGEQLLLLGRLLAWGEDPTGVAKMIELLDAGAFELSLATLQTLRLPAFHGWEAANSALALWLADQVAEEMPVLWTEGQLALFESSSGAHRRAALRSLRSVLHVQDPELAQAALLAVGRSGSSLGDEEIRSLEVLAGGLGANATLAATLLQQVEQQKRFRSKIAAMQRLRSGGSAEGSPPQGRFAVLEELLLRIENQHMEGEKFEEKELIAAAADGMLRRLDPHSDYFTSEEYGQFVFDMRQAYGGIGAYVNTVDNVFTITRPIYSGPAYAAGLLSGDKILEVDGWSTADQSNDEIIKRLKGTPGTEVVLSVYRVGWSEPQDYVIERARIKLPTLQSEILPGGILYLELIDFSEDVALMIVRAIDEAMDQGEVQGIVLDLRNNPGGYLVEAVQICDLFLPKGKVVVSSRSRSGSDEFYTTRVGRLIDPDVPLAILINQYSASASEIVAGALSVHGRAVTVGRRTHGKGSIQDVFPMEVEKDEKFTDTHSAAGPRNGVRDDWESFEDANGNDRYDYGSRVKLTIAYYYLPDGSTIHTQRDREGRVTKEGGIQPDREVEMEELDFMEARELNRLLAEDPFRPFARNLVEGNPELAVELAQNDGRDVTRYPGWEDFYSSLNTELEPQEVRRWLRRFLRNEVSDARGKVFPGFGFFGDFLEDRQLQEAIRAILDSRSLAHSEIPEYADLMEAAG